MVDSEEKAAGRNTADDDTMMIGRFEAKHYWFLMNLGLYQTAQFKYYYLMYRGLND